MNASSLTPPAISVENLSHSFKELRAVESISFEVQPETLHGFVGPNGAGKTTTLKLISTLLVPQLGDIRVFGQNVLHDFKTVRRRVGLMPDHFCMYRQMTVFEYLDFFAAAYGLPPKQRNRVIDDLLELTDMHGRKDDVINGLSRGMQQRVSLARVLVNDPDLLLLDEPASGLDPRARIELMEILRELRLMGKTIFISSHILSELAELCDSVTIIDRGKLRYSGTMDRLLVHDDQHPTYSLTLSDGLPDLEERLRAIPAVVEAEQIGETPEYHVSVDLTLTDKSSLLRNVLDLGVTIESFTRTRKHLNQAFMDLTQSGVC